MRMNEIMLLDPDESLSQIMWRQCDLSPAFCVCVVLMQGNK